MPNININTVTYPKPNTQTQVCINNYTIENANIELEDPIVNDNTNISFDLSLNYIDYAIPGNIFQLGKTSLSFTNENIPYAFSDIVSLCKLQTNILAQLFYTPSPWDSTVVYNINDIISFTLNNLTYTYMSLVNMNLVDSTVSGNINFPPNLYYNYWQLQEYSFVGMADINNPTDELYPYPVGYQVYYNQNYYNANSTTQYATPSKRGIYTCNTPTWATGVSYNTGALVYYTPTGGLLNLYISTIDNNTTVPGTSGNSNWEVTVNNPQPPIIKNTTTGVLSFNTTYWTLQTWDADITYNQNYIVYYTPTGGVQTLYISLVNNNFNNIPSSTSTYWATTSL